MAWGARSFKCQTASVQVFPDRLPVKGISIHSIGGIFSKWANKTMQEDLSAQLTLLVPERKPGTTGVETFASPPKILSIGLCPGAKSRRKPMNRGVLTPAIRFYRLRHHPPGAHHWTFTFQLTSKKTIFESEQKSSADPRQSGFLWLYRAVSR